MIKTGVMLMGIYGPDGKIWDWRAKLEQWKKSGVVGVDIFHVMLSASGETPQSMKKVLDDLGLEPTMFCIPTNLVSPHKDVRQKSLDMVKYGIEVCQLLGVKQLFSHGGQHDNQGEDAFLRYMDGLNIAAQLALEANLLFSIENAGKMCNNGDALLRTLDMVHAPNMRIVFDGGNFITQNDEPHTAIMKLREKVAHVHVKSHVPAPSDYPKPYKYCPTGQGHPDYAFIKDMLLEVGYDGYFSFETEGGPDADYDGSIATLARILKQ